MPIARRPSARELSQRASPLIEGATERGRVSMRTRLERLRLAWRSLFQAGVSVGIAWEVAHDLIGHPRPFFAPVSAIVTLGLTVSQRGRRAAELAFGVAVGIAVSDLLVLGIGTGTGQLAIVVMLAMAAAIFLGSGQMIATQAAVSAVLVTTIQAPTSGFTFTRFIDALVGGATALAVNAIVLPARPVEMVQRAARPVLEELAATLHDVADAIGRRDHDLAGAALARARAIDELGLRFSQAVVVGRETIRYAPPRRRAREAVEAYADASHWIDLAVRNTRVLARGAIRALDLDENVPPEVADAIRELAAAVLALEPALDDPDRAGEVREPALRAAADATAVLERTGNLSVSVIVGQVRSTAVDLISSTGESYEDAAAAVRDAARAAQA